MDPAPALIDAELAAFLQGGISINLGACGRDLQPSVARSLGCTVSGTQVRVLVSLRQCAALLAHVAETRRLAVVFSDPRSHRTVQLKGMDARLEPAQAADRAVMQSYRNAFACTLAGIGQNPALVPAFLDCPEGDLAVIALTPDAAYSQTPGPNAGQPLGKAP